jgi:uncharacterized protein YggE
MAAARDKADVYCRAARVSLGAVLSIEDVNPNVVRGGGEVTASGEVASDDAGPDRALSPGTNTVTAAVTIVFAISSVEQDPPS